MLAKRLDTEKIVGIVLITLLIIYPSFSGAFGTQLMGKFIIFAILAISLDLIWGYTGLLSLGHAVFFGLGGYILALSYTFQSGVPSFMLRFDITEIPAFMQPLTNIHFALFLGIAIPGLLAFILGFFIFKGKVNGVYFAIITIALAMVFQLSITTLQPYTGGSNGLMGLPMFPIFGSAFSLNNFYYLCLFFLIATYILVRWLTRSHFGKVIKAVRENEKRVNYFGYNSDNYKIIVFSISAMLAGFAGMLFVSMNGFISPTDIGVTFSTMIVLWVAIGGRGTLMGAVIGAIGINWISNSLSEFYPDVWQLFLGLIMVVVVMYLPDGVFGTIKNWRIREKEKVTQTNYPKDISYIKK